jgi:hypothetical protein
MIWNGSGGQEMKEIVLDSPRVSGSSIEYRLHVSRSLRKYFLSDTLYVQYDSGVDLRNVDAGILSIPMAALIVPIAWAVGADVQLPEIDAAYMQSLDRVKDPYRSMHPTFSFAGRIRAQKETRSRFEGSRTCMLFTAGVDSLTSYLRHKQEKPDLVSVWGLPDAPPYQDAFGKTMWANIGRFAGLDECEVIRVKTDMISGINRELLSRQFGLQWYPDAGFGMSLLGLCAPIARSRRIGTAIIASSWTVDYKGPPGSHPSVDNNLSWADVRTLHDGHELSRQQKVSYLCEPENRRYLAHLRVCWEWALSRNCGHCEKCFRTIAGLVAEEVDPNHCNFKVNEATFPYMADCFVKGKLALHDMQMCLWKDIQQRIPERIDTDIHGSREFLTWLKSYDLSHHKVSNTRRRLREVHRRYLNGRLNARSIRRKVRCYWYILLDRLRLV